MTDTPVHKASADLAGEFEFNLPKGFDLIAEDPELGPKIVESLAEIEQRLSRAVENTNHLADVASRHLLDAGGKRVRPLLTLLAAAAGGEINDKVLDAAVVVELTHLATLYHDDVMDDAPKRRGVDTAQTIWGNSVAILTGDLIFARASLIVSELGARALATQARTFERLVLGQLFETTGPQNGDDLYNHYIKVIEGKTGSLISAAGEYGTVLAEAPESAVQMLVRYGELVGVAFQLADDVIDLTGGTAAGKTPTILLAQEAEAGDEEAQRIQTMISGDLSSDAALADAVAALSAHPVTQKAWDIAYSWADEAIATIEPLPDSTAKEALKSFAHAVVKRDI